MERECDGNGEMLRLQRRGAMAAAGKRRSGGARY